MRLEVRQKCQTSSGGSHVTIFDADMELLASSSTVEVVVADAALADVDFLSRDEIEEIALRGIREGAEQALAPRHLGAAIRVTRLVVHPVDFRRWAFERFTRLAILELLEAPGEQARRQPTAPPEAHGQGDETVRLAAHVEDHRI